MTIKRDQRKDPVTGAPEIISKYILALRDLQDFYREFPKETLNAFILFDGYSDDLSRALRL
jgi:hypothetical protein